MFRDGYRRMNEKLTPSAALNARTLERMEAPAKKPLRPRRALIAAAALALAVCLSLTAVAAGVPGFREMLFGKETPFSWALTPQIASAEKDGIRLEILGSMAQEDCLTVYYTLQDVEGLGRISDQISPLPMLYVDGEFAYEMNAGHQKQVMHYDPETQTVLCRKDWANLYDNENQPLHLGDNCQIKMEINFLIRLEHTWDYIPLDLTPVEDPETITVENPYENASGNIFMPVKDDEGNDVLDEKGNVVYEELTMAEYMEYLANQAKAMGYDFPIKTQFTFLKPGEAAPVSGLEDLSVTACGFLDGSLHLQINEEAFYSTGNTGKLYDVLVAEVGNGQNIANQLSEIFQTTAPGAGWSGRALDLAVNRLRVNEGGEFFCLDENGEAVSSYNSENYVPQYHELVFKIGPEELDQYEFYIRAIENTTMEVGLSAEFPLGQGQQSSSVTFGTTEINGVQLGKVIVTPMCITLETPVQTSEENYWSEQAQAGFFAAKPLDEIQKLEIVCGNKITVYQAIESSSGCKYIDSADSPPGYAWVDYVNLFTDGSPVDPSAVTAIRYKGQEIPLTPAE